MTNEGVELCFVYFGHPPTDSGFILVCITCPVRENAKSNLWHQEPKIKILRFQFSRVLSKHEKSLKEKQVWTEKKPQTFVSSSSHSFKYWALCSLWLALPTFAFFQWKSTRTRSCEAVEVKMSFAVSNVELNNSLCNNMQRWQRLVTVKAWKWILIRHKEKFLSYEHGKRVATLFREWAFEVFKSIDGKKIFSLRLLWS